MFKLAYKTILFSLLFIIGLSYLGDFFKEKKLNDFSRNYYRNLGTNIDIAVFGNSHAHNSIDTRFLEKKLNIRAYNFAGDGQRLESTLAIADEVIGSNNLQLAIIEMFYGSTSSIIPTDEKAKFAQFNTLDNTAFSFEKLRSYAKIYEFKDIVSLSPVTRRHTLWPNVLAGEKYTINSQSDFYNGFFTKMYYSESLFQKSMKAAQKGKRNFKDIGEKDKENIRLLIEKFEDHDIPYLIITAPYNEDVRGENHISYNKALAAFLKKIKAPHINYNTLKDSLSIKQKDYLNVGHLNTQGAIKVSQHLATYISENYNVEDKNFNDTDLYNNRYAIIDKNLKGIYINKELKPLKNMGINKVYFYKAMDNYYEFIVERPKDSFEGFSLHYSFNFNDSEKNKINSAQREKINKEGLVSQYFKFSDNITYQGKEYCFFRFYTVFNKIKNLKLIAQKGNKKIEIINLDTLNLNHAIRY